VSGKVVVEVITQCEAEVIWKEIPASQLKNTLEKMRSNQFQCVAWQGDTYLGGTWFDLNTKRWKAELQEQEW